MSWDRERLVIVFLLICSLALWFYLTYLEDAIYVSSFNLRQAEQQAKQLHNVNEQLLESMLEDESYTKIASEAASEGFVPAPFVTP